MRHIGDMLNPFKRLIHRGRGHAGSFAVQESSLDPATLPFKIGSVVANRYQVTKIIGVGGYSIVFLIRDRESSTWYALKTLREDFSGDPDVMEQFRKEARVWIGLERHPNIVRADFITELNQRLCIGMEYIEPNSDGFNSLDGYLKKSPPGLEQSIRWGIQFCRGMEYARAHGIRCHRDVKPANIMIDSARKVKITDFGFAEVISRSAAVSGRRRLPQQGGLGTPIYMAPEQFMNAPSCDERSDIYSMGVILFQMAARGRLPFYPHQGGRRMNRVQLWAAMHRLHAQFPVPPLHSPLFPVIKKCLEKEPSMRYQIFKDLRVDLEIVLKKKFSGIEREAAVGGAEGWELYNRGFSLANLGDYEGALIQYDRSLERDPDNADAWHNRGVCLRNMGRMDAAIGSFEKAVSIAPEHIAALRNLGTTLRGMGRLPECLPWLVRAVALDPHDETSWLNKALAEESLGLSSEAVESYRTFLALPPVLFTSHEKHAHSFVRQFERDRNARST
jgi:tetratricopeptide (TPR) repeat protein